jgi:hypothetical protein
MRASNLSSGPADAQETGLNETDSAALRIPRQVRNTPVSIPQNAR